MGYLLASERDGDQIVLSWVGPRDYAIACAALLGDGDVSVYYHRVADAGKDPLTAIEEDLVGETIESDALAMADESRATSVGMLLALAAHGQVRVSDEQLWGLVTSANGAYVRFRGMDLQRAGVDMTPGAAAVTDMDAALADLLGAPAPTAAEPTSDPADEWSPEASLCAALSHEAMEALSA